MTNIMVNEDDNNIHELNSEEWMKMIENTLNEEEDPLSAGDILGEVYHELSKLSPSQALASSPDPVALVANNIQSFGENLFVDVHDQGVAFAYSHAPTPSNVVPATTNTQLPSPHNINHVASD
ncbi:hypothetical protein V8G54_033519 [Vigna mungo]|uniref:Uncharacterized protein n=1 Tax=Vigna mungo TaxID=3915 RepID=A0AAQ3MP54_VIGMU